ncbi:MAG: carboxypeptidase-like regulatory domain-containing protein [Candidatus Bathyarchaeia archaeon]
MKKLFLTILFLFSVLALAPTHLKPTLSSDGLPYGGGLVYGQVLGFNMYDELIPLEWARVTAIDESEEIIESVSTLSGGHYEMFLPVGRFRLEVEHPGYITQTMNIAVSSGSSTSVNFYLEQSGVPIPEFSDFTLQLLMIFTLLASTAIIGKTKIFNKRFRFA